MEENQSNNQSSFDSDHDVISGPSISERSERATTKAYALFLVLLFLVAGSITYFANRSNNTNNNTPTTTNSVASIENSFATKVAPAQVTISSTGFSPATISIQKGQAVTWVNKDSKSHQVASDPYPTDNTLPGLNSRGPLSQNQAYTYVFSSPGTFTYHDNLNPTLEGTVEVNR